MRGDPATWYKADVPTVMHSRFFEPDNDYITGAAPDMPHNGSNFSWYVSGGVAVSHDADFFAHIFGRAKAGMNMGTSDDSSMTHPLSLHHYDSSFGGYVR